MMMGRTLTRWLDAGLISPDQADSIHAFERARRGNRFGRGLTGAALFAILCGVLAVIAANWMDIPPTVKIGAHLLLNGIVAAFLWRAADMVRRDGLCVLLFGLTLTLIVLIGQVFQLGGGWSGALILWMTATVPLMAVYAHTRITVLPWMLAFLATIMVVMEEYLGGLADAHATMIVVLVAAFLPIALIADGNIGLVRRHRPVWADVCIRTGFILALALATIACFLWDGHTDREIAAMAAGIEWAPGRLQAALIGLFVLSLAAQAGYAVYKKYYAGSPGDKAGAQIIAACTLSMALPVTGAASHGDIIAPLHFIALWALIGWIAQDQGWHRLVSLAIFLIAARIFIIYLDLMGGLMTTGIGLISGGVIVLILIWGSRRLSRRIRKAGA